MAEFAAESLASLFEPDVVLPSQFDNSNNRGIGGGERKLMAALLSDGIEAYISHATSIEASYRRSEVCDWVETKDPAYVFSFDCVCECLGIDPDYLRLGLSRYVSAIHDQRKQGRVAHSWKKIRRPRK